MKTTEQIIAEATEILEHHNVLPRTTVTKLERALRTGNTERLTEGLRLAHLHDQKIEEQRQQDVEIQQLLDDETVIEELAALVEAKKLEAISLYVRLSGHQAVIHPAKTVRFVCFLGELEGILANIQVTDKALDEVKAWLKRAEDFKTGIDAKLRQAPRQTERVHVAA